MFNYHWLKIGINQNLSFWKRYSQFCTNIKYPSHYKLTPSQKKEYQNDLMPQIKKECQAVFKQAFDSLNSWFKNQKDPPHEALNPILHLLKSQSE